MDGEAGDKLFGLEVCYERSCLKSLQAVPPAVNSEFITMTAKIMADSTTNGLHVEPVEGAQDRTMRSVRLSRGYRAVGSLQGRLMLFLHVNEHDKAYRWARGRTVALDTATNRVRIVEAEPAEIAPSAPSPVEGQPGLFDAFDDDVLLKLGVTAAELPRVRTIVSEADLDAQETELDATSFDILCGLQSGYAPDEIPTLLGMPEGAEGAAPVPSVEDLSEAILTDEGRATIFLPKDEAELRRVLEGDLRSWRVFLHPEQRRFAYRDYNGPALIRGGAGTGKTVVAMHRAKHLADSLVVDPTRRDERVLVTTFTTNLARDIEANLRTLCPEHLDRVTPRIEVQNLDAWVGDFLRRRGFAREIVFPGSARVRDIWDEVLDRSEIPEGLSREFIRSEWAQVVQAKGAEDKATYFKASRAGRGTPLDRRKRAALWPIFEAFRGRMREDGLAEPDDAYREAMTLIEREGTALPYAAIVVDEAQDMGEQAFRLIRTIAPKAAANGIFIVGDAHQRIYARKASLSACGIDIRGRSRRLRLNYRTSESIRRWAVALLEGVEVDDLDESLDSLKGYRSIFTGPEPELEGLSSRSEDIEAVVARIAELRSERPDLSAAVLVRSNRLADQVVEHLARKGLDTVRLVDNKADRAEDKGIRVATMHRAKGLEFDAVFMVGVEAGSVPPGPALGAAVDPADRRETIERERSLLHVAATRAKRFLRVSWSGAPSELLVQGRAAAAA